MPEFANAVVKITGDDFEPKLLAEELWNLKLNLTGKLVICVGGGAGNRGRDGEKNGAQRLKNDKAGMAASLINASKLVQAMGPNAVGFTGLSRNVVGRYADSMGRTHPLHYAIGDLAYECEVEALDELERRGGDGVLVVGGGIGRGHVSTDFGAALWARDLVEPDKPTALLKGSNVDGIYADDPRINPNAKFLKHISYRQAIENGLSVMDPSSWPILEGGEIVTLVYENAEGNAERALDGAIGSRIDVHGQRMTA